MHAIKTIDAGGRRSSLGFALAALLLATTSAAFAGGNCLSINGIGSRPQSSLVGASFSSDGTTVTYTFDSLVDTSPVGGVPGLISYCVYPARAANFVVAAAFGGEGSLFDTVGSGANFGFVRSGGNPTNIALNGTTGIVMGTATWDPGSAPGDQTILLHINDAAECNRLYPGGGSDTCWVFPSPHVDAEPLKVLKDATPSFDHTYGWSIVKAVDKTSVKQVGGTATFNYTVTVTHDAGTDSNWQVTGVIVVSNPNAFPVSADVTDAIDNGGVCTVAGGAGAVIPGGSQGSPFEYTCTYSASPDPLSGSNTATVTWATQGALAAGAASYTVANIDFSTTTPTVYDDCVAVSDSVVGNLGTVCSADANPTAFNYARTIPVPQWNCQSFDNTAAFTTNTSGTTGSASKTVRVCGPANTGALTMGFWQNKNGQGLITGQAASGVCPSSAYLRLYAPFQDLSATATCKQVATYVTNVIKAASASGAAMNAMLKAQMLATTLDTYFIAGPSGPIGGVAIDLTAVCTAIGNCNGHYQDVSSAFGGATSLTVSQILSYAASQSNVGGGVWYGQVKATQELAKNTFDAINNQAAFTP